MKVKEGEDFPDFSLVSDSGKLFRKSDLNNAINIIYFYPKDDTPGCTKEACNFRDEMQEFKRNSIPVYGVSVDDIESHRKFKEKYSLNFVLLSDSKKDLVNKLGIKSISGSSKRVTFILNSTGKIIKIYPNVSPAEHAKEILEWLNKK